MARPRKRDQGTLEKVRGMLFESMKRHASIAEKHPDDLDVQKMTGHALSQLAGQWIKTYEKTEIIARLDAIEQNLTASPLRKVA